ncbi:MAG: hypothetical protein KIS86_16150 [Devosia sp.]|nr:hypothetical protein [Devosia sp.]
MAMTSGHPRAVIPAKAGFTVFLALADTIACLPKLAPVSEQRHAAKQGLKRRELI